jgi:hypothetical protein
LANIRDLYQDDAGRTTEGGCHKHIKHRPRRASPSVRPLSSVFGRQILAVRPEGANHQWRRIPPRELSIDLEADERFGRVTGRAGAS